MKLSDIPTYSLQQAEENFLSSKSDVWVFFQYPEFFPITFTKNEILEELESRRVEEGIKRT